MTRQWPGPCFAQYVTIDGFDYGIRLACAEYGPTFDHIYLRNIAVAGVQNDGNCPAFRDLQAANIGVPAVKQSAGFFILVGATLGGGSASASAIDASGGNVYARDITVSGYGTSVRCVDREET
jgi:hypothetical protein